jgi:hypothetical protein
MLATERDTLAVCCGSAVVLSRFSAGNRQGVRLGKIPSMPATRTSGSAARARRGPRDPGSAPPGPRARFWKPSPSWRCPARPGASVARARRRYSGCPINRRVTVSQPCAPGTTRCPLPDGVASLAAAAQILITPGPCGDPMETRCMTRGGRCPCGVRAGSLGALAEASIIGQPRLLRLLARGRFRRRVRTRRGNAHRRPRTAWAATRPAQPQPERRHARDEEQPRRERQHVAFRHCRHLPALAGALPLLEYCRCWSHRCQSPSLR